ncbi:MAG: flagellar basal body rod protein FlgC, partial [Opitutae bacterium]|nr:flagellar basal body rod protein FlgC [Opitutae bacterium]
MNLISVIDISANALAAQKTRLYIVAQNIANAQTTRTASGGPYQRQVVSFETQLVRSQGAAHSALQSVRVAQVTTDRSPGEQVYNPQHPDASADGMVSMPNVNLSQEMVDL